jgi:hypothetical protein
MAKTILSNDPLAPHLSPEERHRRMALDFEQALRRLQSCLGQNSNTREGPDSGLDELRAEALAIRPKLQRDSRVDSELLRSGLELIYRIEELTSKNCGETEGLDHALLLIGHKHTEATP